MQALAKERLFAGSIIDEQLSLEEESVTAGVARYRRLVAQALERGESANLKSAERFVVHWFPALRAAIKQDQKDSIAGKHYQDATVIAPVLAKLDAERLAVVTINQAVGLTLPYPGGTSSAAVMKAIGNAVLGEHNLDRLGDHDIESRRRRRERLEIEGENANKDRLENEEEHLARLEIQFRQLSPKRVSWWARRKLGDPGVRREAGFKIGARLLWMLIETASARGYDEPFKLAFHHWIAKVTINVRGKPRTRSMGMVRMDAAVIDEIHKGNDIRALIRPKYLPMIVEPYPWVQDDKDTEKVTQGGYVGIRTPLMSHPTKLQKALLKKADKRPLFERLHAVTSTPWKINDRVLALAKALWDRGGGEVEIPHADNRPSIPRPSSYNPDLPPRQRWGGVDPEARERYEKESAAIRKDNRGRRSLRAAFLPKLMLAERFADVPAFYFPHQFCYRYRFYPLPQPLNHQGDDLCRGLLTRATAKPLGNRGVWWLYVHAANCWGNGVDKMTFQQRIKWVEDHSKEIEKATSDPINDEFWRQAEKPWSFIAACYSLCDPDGDGQHQRIRIDGTCNGLQWYAALARDRAGAAAVNIVPSEQRNSVYADIADRTRQLIAGDTLSPHARTALPWITTDVVKAPTMTTLYGSKEYRKRRQVLDKIAKHMEGWERQTRYDVSEYVEGKVTQAIAGVCPGAERIMAWFRECASRISKTGRPVQWTTRLGVPVVQDRFKHHRYDSDRIQTILQMVIVKLDDRPAKINTLAQKNGVAANAIHSIDAAHALNTALVCRQDGIEPSVIHDGYESHCADGDNLTHHVLNEFVGLAEQPILEDLAAEWRTLYGIEIPDPPAKGDWNVREALNATYAFS